MRVYRLLIVNKKKESAPSGKDLILVVKVTVGARYLDSVMKELFGNK